MTVSTTTPVYQLSKEDFIKKYETLDYSSAIASGLFDQVEDDNVITTYGNSEKIKEIYVFDQSWHIALLVSGKYIIEYSAQDVRTFSNFEEATQDLWKLYNFHAPYMH